MPIKKERLRELAQDYYIQNIDATYAEIHELYGVSVRVLNNWKAKYKWDDLRRNYHTSPVRIKQLLQEETLSMLEGNSPKFNSDAIAKLMSAIERCEKRLDPSIIALVLKDLDNYTSKLDAKFANEAIKYHRQYLLHKINEIA